MRWFKSAWLGGRSGRADGGNGGGRGGEGKRRSDGVVWRETGSGEFGIGYSVLFSILVLVTSNSVAGDTVGGVVTEVGPLDPRIVRFFCEARFESFGTPLEDCQRLVAPMGSTICLRLNEDTARRDTRRVTQLFLNTNY